MNKLHDGQINHHIGLQHVASGLVRQALAKIDVHDHRIVMELGKFAASAMERIPVQRRDAAIQTIGQINAEAYAELVSSLWQELVAVAEYEVEFCTRLLGESGITAKAAFDPDALKARRFIRGQTVHQAFESQRDNKFRLLRKVIVAEAEPMALIRKVRGTEARCFKDGALAMARHATAHLVRSAVNHTANASRMMLWRELG